ncbi:MAG: DUF3078 domain-containing protein [Lentimicrobiaceae bacterium]|nr:DUF3078 domain-containing protein [Lentimicrobiaceae bacterium]
MKNLLFICFIFISGNILAQVTDAEKHLRTQNNDTIKGWKTGGVTALNFSQTSLTNWAAGGQSSLAGNTMINLFAYYKKGKSSWDNTLDFGYGLLKQADKKKAWKTDDKIELLSKYGEKAYRNWYYAVLVNFKTQISPGYNYPNDSVKISNFFAPAYLLGAIGMDYKPNENFNVFITPFTERFTFVYDQTLANNGAFGVDPATYDTTGKVIKKGKNLRTEFGGYVRMLFKHTLMQNVAFQTKLDLFSNYLKNPQNVDINWEVLLSLKVNKFISTTVSTQLVYDHDVLIVDGKKPDGTDKKGPRTQFKEVLGVGFSYNF